MRCLASTRTRGRGPPPVTSVAHLNVTRQRHRGGTARSQGHALRSQHRKPVRSSGSVRRGRRGQRVIRLHAAGSLDPTKELRASLVRELTRDKVLKELRVRRELRSPYQGDPRFEVVGDDKRDESHAKAPSFVLTTFDQHVLVEVEIGKHLQERIRSSRRSSMRSGFEYSRYVECIDRLDLESPHIHEFPRSEEHTSELQSRVD